MLVRCPTSGRAPSSRVAVVPGRQRRCPGRQMNTTPLIDCVDHLVVQGEEGDPVPRRPLSTPSCTEEVANVRKDPTDKLR